MVRRGRSNTDEEERKERIPRAATQKMIVPIGKRKLRTKCTSDEAGAKCVMSESDSKNLCVSVCVSNSACKVKSKIDF